MHCFKTYMSNINIICDSLTINIYEHNSEKKLYKGCFIQFNIESVSVCSDPVLGRDECIK